LFSTTYITASTYDITTVLVFGSNIIIQEVGFSENSTISLSLTGSYINFRPWNNTSNSNSNCS